MICRPLYSETMLLTRYSKCLFSATQLPYIVRVTNIFEREWYVGVCECAYVGVYLYIHIYTHTNIYTSKCSYMYIIYNVVYVYKCSYIHELFHVYMSE